MTLKFWSFPNCVSGEIQSKNLYRIPLRNLVGRSIERPLKSPLVSKVITPPTSIGLGIAAIPVTHSLSLSRMEIKEIASRTRRELLGNHSCRGLFPQLVNRPAGARLQGALIFKTWRLKRKFGASKMARRVQALAVKLADLSSSPRTYMVEGEN